MASWYTACIATAAFPSIRRWSTRSKRSSPARRKFFGHPERGRWAAHMAAEHASRHDREATFPVEGLAELAANGYLALVVPEAVGGGGATITELVLGNLELSKGDASLGLVVAMHSALLGRVRDAALWPASLVERVGRSVVESGALITSLACVPAMGSPDGGGLPATAAVRTGSGVRPH